MSLAERIGAYEPTVSQYRLTDRQMEKFNKHPRVLAMTGAQYLELLRKLERKIGYKEEVRIH